VCFETTADVASAVSHCVSGRELIDHGFADDVVIATEINACGVARVLLVSQVPGFGTKMRVNVAPGAIMLPATGTWALTTNIWSVSAWGFSTRSGSIPW
jgi:hypothetical protein